MTYLPQSTNGRMNVTLGGNTAGVGALVSTGTLTLAGGNNITLSQNGNAITISGGAGGGAGSNTFGMSNIGNTSGTTGVVSGSAVQYAFAGGNNVTLSQSINASSGTITISAASQTIQTQNVHNLTLGGNTAGAMAHVSSGTLTLAGGNNITLSQNGNAVTISGGAGAAATTGMYFDNMFQQNSVQAISYTSVSTGMFGRVLIQPLAPGNELFPYDMTASTMMFGFSNSGSSAISGAHSSSWYIGIYTRVNSTQLSLVNSVMASYGMSANINNSASYMGARWLTAHSSQFSSSPVFKAGSRYFFGVLARTAGASYASISLAGMHLGQSVQRSGLMAAAVSSNTSYNAWHPFMGVHSLTTHTALPASIANSEINKASAYANFIPQVIFDAGLGVVN